MSITTKQHSSAITHLLNGTLTSIKSVIPLTFDIDKPQRLDKNFNINFGVFIGITGDIQGKLVLAGRQETFGSIGAIMFGMPLEGEMLDSFSGELGNMIAGGLSTNIFEKDININITAPTIMNGHTSLSGYKEAIGIPVHFENNGEMNIYLLID